MITEERTALDINSASRFAEGSAEIVAYYNLWREITRLAGQPAYDEAEWADNRLYFRIDYADKAREWPLWKQLGDWAAWIIEPTARGYYKVIHSLWHERAPERSESVVAIFSLLADAGKYVILRVGDAARLYLRLEALPIKWRADGLDPRIRIATPAEEAIDYVTTIRPGTRKSFAMQHLKQYSLDDQPTQFAFTFPSEELSMQVLTLSYAQLNALLITGIPDSIMSKISS